MQVCNTLFCTGQDTIINFAYIDRFSRSIEGSSSEQDLDLNDDYYLLFGKGQDRQS